MNDKEKKLLMDIRKDLNYCYEYHGNPYAPTLTSLSDALKKINQLLGG